MFKAQVLRRNLSLFNRVPYSRIARSAARDGHETIVIQRVHIRRPFLSKSRLVGAVAIAGASYGLTRYLGLEIEVEEVEQKEQKSARSNNQAHVEDKDKETGQEADHEDDEEEEYDDVLLFLPTGFSRPCSKTYYRGSDPEWQEFRRIANDQPRIIKIRRELVATIRSSAAKNPGYIARYGQVDTSKGGFWLEVKFPDGPPVEYERPGIELTEDLEWRKATRLVEEAHHHRLTKAFLPKEVAVALYEDTKRKARISWKDFRVYMGWDEKSEPDTAQQLIQRIGVHPPSAPTSTAPSNNATPNSPSTSPANDTQRTASSPSTAPVDGLAKDLGLVLPDPKKLTMDLSQVRQDFSKASKPYDMQAPRGTFLVNGLVEVYGARSRVTVNVSAAYDPKQARYLSMKLGVWSITDHRQIPKGGP
ncbi:hypothetical protein BKA66DRAFT_545469 [Pyrenochaeta sp. MPI-SDFR-AT-0127]|nr:hypothetical protein BKA66DRAFT_545469 [Pyrenochaeta sp. MPI-SDFR-AT-0127]